MEFGGLFENLVNVAAPFKTALHGWANQLTGCPCLCRQYPFSEERLKSKGIFGALIQLGVNLRPIRENSRRPDICIRGRWPFSMGSVRIVHGNRTYVSAPLP